MGDQEIIQEEVPASQPHSPLPTQSPTKARQAVEPGQMDFYDALRELAGGRRIRKLEWPNPGDYGILRNSRVQIFLTKDGLFHDWILNDGDLAGDDWVIFP